MTKGFRKNMYYVRDTGSPFFSEAYFVLRGNLPVTENDLAAEADRIVREKFCGKPRRRWIRKLLGIALFSGGAGAGAAVTAFILYLVR